MILTRSPLRISFVGGGSDLPAYCAKEKGMVVSTTIEQSVYVMLSAPRWEGGYRLSYREQIEEVDYLGGIQHDLVREALWMARAINVQSAEVISYADLPSRSGLGSSGAFLTALGVALAEGSAADPKSLARWASYIEIERCKRPAGYQDQTASAFGGFRSYTFTHGGVIDAGLDCVETPGVKELEQRCLLIDTGIRADSAPILSRQSDQLQSPFGFETMRSMANLAGAFQDALLCGRIDTCGEIVDASWALKKSFDGAMSPPIVDDMMRFAKEQGAIGGKLCGAGGRGMLLLIARDQERSDLLYAMKNRFHTRAILPKFSSFGAHVVFSSKEPSS